MIDIFTPPPIPFPTLTHILQTISTQNIKSLPGTVALTTNPPKMYNEEVTKKLKEWMGDEEQSEVKSEFAEKKIKISLKVSL